MNRKRSGNAALVVLSIVVVAVLLLATVGGVAYAVFSNQQPSEPASTPATSTPAGWRCDENGCRPIGVMIPGELAAREMQAIVNRGEAVVQRPYHASDGVELDADLMVLGSTAPGTDTAVPPNVASKAVPHADLTAPSPRSPVTSQVRSVPHMDRSEARTCSGPNCGQSSSTDTSRRRFRILGRRY